LKELERHQPIAIGLDIYRDYPANKAYPTLAAKLRDPDSSIVGVCKVSVQEAGDIGVAPPPEMSLDQIGFSDVLGDPDLIIRRHYLAFTPPNSSPCQAAYGLSVQLALRYLATKGINLEFTPQKAWKLGKLEFAPLEAHTGGYQKNDALGHQILLNYRSAPTPLDLATRVTMADVLAGKVRPAQIKDRLILIGTTARSFKDYVLTPYTTVEGNLQQIPGVLLQGQMVSQLLSAALDGRPLIGTWNFAQDSLWIWGWAIGGGCLVLWLRRPLYLALATGISILILAGASLVLLQGGYWVPVVPTVIAIIGTQGILALIMGIDRQDP
jgi:CHASE2 domain-containing sensor protein